MTETLAGYRSTSVLHAVGDESSLDLATALGQTPTGTQLHPTFFSGFLAHPDVTAAGLLAVADVAAAQYADPGLAKRVANLDPILTAGVDNLRVEAFSACNGVYARFDLLPGGIESGDISRGTTNIDINPPLRNALARTRHHQLLHLRVGDDGATLSSPTSTHTERKVDLPDRWVRGLAEVPALARDLNPVATLSRPAALAFLRSLPTTAAPGPSFHVIPAPNGARRSTRTVPGSVHLAGATRLQSHRRILPWTSKLSILAGPTGASGWVFDLPGGRFSLLLSPGPYRSFSGEGTLLTRLAAGAAAVTGTRLMRELRWQSNLDVSALARQTSVDRGDIDAGLAWLASAGRLGYDTSNASWFHRELPVDTDSILRRHPRLASGQRLADAGRVQRIGDTTYAVTGDQNRCYTVIKQEAAWHCTCPWRHEADAGRGPCKHVLAVIATPPPAKIDRRRTH